MMYFRLFLYPYGLNLVNGLMENEINWLIDWLIDREGLKQEDALSP